MSSRRQRRTLNPQASIITQEAEAARNTYIPDPQYQGHEREIGAGGFNVGVGGSTQSKSGRVIDALLSSVPQNQGFYLKLLKEIQPNQFQFKQQILNYDTWSDLQLEIANIVRANTSKFPRSWGTGLYRVIIWRDQGIRDAQNYKPIDFYIDALDEGGLVSSNQPATTPTADPFGMMSTIAPVLEQLRAFMPAPADPAKTQDLMSNAFVRGMEINKSEGNNSNTMMLGFMTMMMGTMKELIGASRPPVEINPGKSLKTEMVETLSIMKEMGVLPSVRAEQPKTIVDFMSELRALGLDPFKREDPTEQLGKLKTLIGIVEGFAGERTGPITPEKPDMLEGLVTAIAPHVGKILEIMGTNANAQLAAAQAPRQIIMQPNGEPSMSPQAAPMPPPPVQQAPLEPNMQLFNDAVINKDREKYPQILRLMETVAMGKELVAGLKSGQITPSIFYNMVSQWTAPLMKNPMFANNLREFTENFVAYVMNPAPQTSSVSSAPKPIEAACNLCGVRYNFKSPEEFLADEKKCDNPLTDEQNETTVCTGTLTRV